MHCVATVMISASPSDPAAAKPLHADLVRTSRWGEGVSSSVACLWAPVVNGNSAGEAWVLARADYERAPWRRVSARAEHGSLSRDMGSRPVYRSGGHTPSAKVGCLLTRRRVKVKNSDHHFEAPVLHAP